MKKVTTSSNEETKQYAYRVARSFRGGEIIALEGNLGAGKTTFVQGIAEYFSVKDYVSSPTFTIVQEYRVRNFKQQITNNKQNPTSKKQGSKKIINKNYNITKLIHIDCYRLDSSQELIDIGIKEYFDRTDAIILIEWADKIKDILPPRTYWIRFRRGNKENTRIITVS